MGVLFLLPIEINGSSKGVSQLISFELTFLRWHPFKCFSLDELRGRSLISLRLPKSPEVILLKHAVLNKLDTPESVVLLNQVAILTSARQTKILYNDSRVWVVKEKSLAAAIYSGQTPRRVLRLSEQLATYVDANWVFMCVKGFHDIGLEIHLFRNCVFLFRR